MGNSNKIIPANQQLERKDIARFEHNGILELNAMWSALDTNSRITSTNFYLSLDCEVSDNTSNGFGKVDEKNFTSSLYTTSLKGTENIPIASNGDWNYSLVDAETSAQEAYEKDAQIHSMVTTPIKGVTADTMPSDEEILEQLRNSNADIKVDDQSVDKDELTTDHFKIRWYAVKYVKEDGWHVDGVLVAKEGYLVVKKTFSGDSQAIDQIKRNYSISVQRTTTTENNTIYNLNLSQESDDNTSGYKYYDKKTDTYTWVLKVRPGSQYILKENNYMVDNTWYHSNRYMITNSSDATDTWQDYNDTGVEVTASSYPNDINYTSYQTVSFYNTYVQAGFITFIKEDAFSKQGLENVSFILTDQSNKSITIYKKGEQYSTEAKSLNEGYVKTDKLVTNSKGEIQLKISQGKYRLVENVPVGYEGVKKIDFSIDANGKISESKAYNEENQEVINQIETTESMCMIKNTSKQLTTVTAQGEWKASEDNKLPMTVELWCNGSKLVGNQYTQELNNENEWKYTWNDLPLYVNGSVATYTLRVVKVGNVAYDSASDQDGYRDYKITVDPTKYREGNEGEYNSDPSWLDENGIWHFSNHALVKVHCQPDFTVGDIPIVINWKDSKNEDGLRPENITVWLVKEGVRTANSIELSEENGWTGSFKNVRLQENKVEYHYSIDFDRFDNIDYYQTTITGNQIEGFDITNTYQPQKTTVSGKINWQGDEDDLKARPTSVKVILYGDGKEIAQKVVGEEDQWTYSFDDLLVLNKGKIINYTVKQETITDYTTSIEGFNITNVYTPEKILIAGRVQWNDEQDYKGARPDKAHLILYANGKEIAQMDVDATSQWRYQFGSFPIRSNGKEIKYTIKEKNVQDYSTIIEDYTVINNYHPETTTVSGMIKWKGDEKYLQNRPSNIKVILYANGKKQLEKEVYVNNEGNWKYIFENLPIRENKKDIIYTVQIESIQGYITTIEGYTILNEYMPMNNLKPSIEVPNSNKEEESFQENSIKTNTLEAKPHTGDDTNVSMYLILLLGSCLFALVVICLKKANQHK
ncbi:MAG: Cna B-type domain-containing protein [Bacillota bacterium]|nr:Cna B-type domain-containing protein [Bacillota bacterium]